MFSPYPGTKLVLTLDTLKQSPEYKTWWERSGSSMLVLHGDNNRKYSVSPQSWLSLAPVDLVLELQSLASSWSAAPTPTPTPTPAIAYFNCDGNSDPYRPDRAVVVKPEQVLYSIAEQLLEQQSRIMRKMSDVEDMAHRLRRIHSDEGAPPNALVDDSCQNIRQILQRCQAAQTLYVVIDRPELAEGCETWYFVRSLLGLVEDDESAAARLKVLLVVKTLFWDIEDWRGIVDERTLREGKLVILKRNQGDCD